MKKNKKATSILEAMIVLLVIITGVVGLYKTFNNSIKLSNSTKNRIEAIEIAREGIEALKNIRDTNWLKFAGDKKHCFKTLNYDSQCVGDNSWTSGNYIENNSHYIVYQGNDFKWYLNKPSISGTYDFKNSDYRNKFRVYKKDGYYTQSGTTEKTIFTREIKIENMTNTGFTVHSIVSWSDSSKSGNHKIDIENLITNWAKE